MTGPYTHIGLGSVEDAAPADGFGDRWEARAARTALDAQDKAGPGGLEFLAFGARHDAGGESVDDPWVNEGRCPSG
jgi:hypothetical protein